jgi:BirA family biotin operon repressor/biotin-[acetyl-CoA-carboxylase] ligase
VGRDIEYHSRIDSTQTRARTLADEGAERGIVVADEQGAGLGTHGRAWHAAAGTSLLSSWILRPAPAAPALFAALAGVAIARAFDALGVGGAHLKWPNDVELEGKKVAGVLAHGSSDGAGGVVVLGIGINVHQRAEDFPAELRGVATSLAIARGPVDRVALLAGLARELDRLEGGAERQPALDEWRERSSLSGKAVEVRVPGRPPFAGTATGIADDGSLIVHTAAGIERVVAGEVRRA